MASPLVHFMAGTATLALLAGCSRSSGSPAMPVPADSVASGIVVQSSVAQGSTGQTCASTPTASQAAHFWYPGKAVRPTRVVHAFLHAPRLKASARVIVVADTANNVLDAFDSKGQQIGELSGFNRPDGLASDTRGNLYVADLNNQRIVVISKIGAAPSVLGEPGEYPSGVDSYHNGEVIAAANSGINCQPGSVTFFLHGALRKTIKSGALSSAWFCAFDASGNLYVDGLDANRRPTVGEIVGGVDGTAFTPLRTTNTIFSVGGIQVTTTGQIAILDQAGALYTYDPPSRDFVGTPSLGAPISTTTLKGALVTAGFAFSKDRDSLYIADVGAAAAKEFAYPASSDAMTTIPISGLPIGIAIVPTQVPKNT